jgi:hypothetical protein
MTNRKTNNKAIKRRKKQCGKAVENIHEILTTSSGPVTISELLEEMYFTLMCSESYIAQDNDKRREATFLYQIMMEDLDKLKTVAW